MFSYLLTQSLIHLMNTFPRIGIQVEHNSVTETSLGGTHFPPDNPKINLDTTHPPSALTVSNYIITSATLKIPDMSCFLFHQIFPLKPPSSIGFPTGFTVSPWIPPTLEAAMPHPGAHHRGLWPFSHGNFKAIRRCSTAKLWNICILGKSKFHNNFAFDRLLYDVFWCECVWVTIQLWMINDDVEVKIYSIATLVIFCKCQMLELCKLTEFKTNVTLMFWIGIHWGLHHSAWRCILQAKLHVWCVHSSKDNWRKCPSLHHKKVLSITSASCEMLRTSWKHTSNHESKTKTLFQQHSKTQKKTKLAISIFPADSLLWHQEHPQQKPFRLAPKKCQMVLYSWQTCLSFQLTLDDGK